MTQMDLLIHFAERLRSKGRYVLLLLSDKVDSIDAFHDEATALEAFEKVNKPGAIVRLLYPAPPPPPDHRSTWN